MADGIIFRTLDVLRWGAAGGLGTGGNLTSLQLDENFWELLTRVQNLETNPPEAVSIQSFTIVGSQMEINMTNGDTQGPFTLPIAIFRDVGEWVNDLPLLPLDFFSVPNRGWYRTRIAHTTPASPAIFDPDAIDEDSGSPTFGQNLYALVFGEDAAIYVVGFFYPGKPGLGIEEDTAMAGHCFVHPVTLLAGLPGSKAKLRVASSIDLTFPIYKNDVTEIGSVDFADGETEGTFTFAADVDFAIDDVLTVLRAEEGVDADARELKVTFNAFRVFE
jgi:hypothetical protein